MRPTEGHCSNDGLPAEFKNKWKAGQLADSLLLEEFLASIIKVLIALFPSFHIYIISYFLQMSSPIIPNL